jgi:formate dehydrogenase iron-sulfur subunit
MSRSMTAAATFSRAHKQLGETGSYRALIPLNRPQPGEQYAFDVSLDACSGCKACVTACHSLNGLEPDESWRSVGLLHGGTPASPFQQTVTTACHHCLDPACMRGCPVKAYEKDPLTGIVSHLDDQCIGCQYCVFMCPYEVPQYRPSKGIVRKCDMCSDRLAASEAPACVQACPTQAIRINLVTRDEVVAASESAGLVAGAPDARLTLPTTTYRSDRVAPRNTLPADYYSVRPAKSHAPLVVMLVLTQLSVGAFCVMHLTGGLGQTSALVALGLGLVALAASVLHLGRPQFGYRAILGLGSSWLSREIVAFGGFAGLAGLYALWPNRALGAAVGLVGAAAVASSAMVYAATRRECWRGANTGFRFAMTALVLGSALQLALAPDSSGATAVAAALAAATAVKLGWEAMLLAKIRDPRHSVDKRVAVLMLGELRPLTVARFALGAVGGIALPLLYLAIHDGPDVGPLFVSALALVSVTCAAAGELCERHLFFVAAAGPRMPGVLP